MGIEINITKLFDVLSSCSSGNERPPFSCRLSARKFGNWKLTTSQVIMENQNHQRVAHPSHQSFWRKNARAVPGRYVAIFYLDVSRLTL